jgi:endonuclease/exonuclease/phosphatase family metal-dependent hydrolase
MAVFSLGAVLLAPPNALAVKIVTYNLLNYSSGRQSEFKAILFELQPDILVVQEIINQSGANYFLANVLNAADGPGGYSMAPFHFGASLNNACYYRSNVATFVAHTWLNTSPRDTDRWQFRVAGYASPQAEFYVYSMHLHSSSSSSRSTQTAAVRANGNALPSGSNFVYAGDFNIDSSSEASYQNLIGSQADNDGRGFDPINTPGGWHNSFSYRFTHTQSTHADNPGQGPGAATGGLDDRFDFLLMSAGLTDGLGVSYVSGTYEPYGNDGNHFNLDINDPPTIPEGAAIADALHGASDHLPVAAEIQVPATITVDAGLDFQTVIVGAAADAELAVANADDVALDRFGYIDELEYSLVAPAGFTAPGGVFFDSAGGDGNLHTIGMDTTTSGVKAGTLEIEVDSQGVDESIVEVSLTGRVLRHAAPSLDDQVELLEDTLDFGTHTPDEFLDQTVMVFNFEYDADQAPLDLYAADITGPSAGFFSIVGGFSPTTVEAAPASYQIAFDDTGASGAYEAQLTFYTRDPESLPGAIEHPQLTVTLLAVLQGAPECEDNADCDDGLYCTGVETCDPQHPEADAQGCVSGTPVDCDDLVSCTEDACNEVSASCTHDVLDSLCDDGLYCNGIESCDPVEDCQDGLLPCDPEAGEFCDEDADACVTAPDSPVVTGIGCRYLSVQPVPGTQPIALRLTSIDLPSLDKYVGADGRPACAPIFQTPDVWGTVLVYGLDVVPSADYSIQAEALSGGISDPATATTSAWGDTVGDFIGGAWTEPNGVVDFRDISSAVEAFGSLPTAPVLQTCDVDPEVPQQVIDFTDIGRIVDAFGGAGYPFPAPEPCP